MNNLPLVSVIITTKNEESVIEDILRSIKNQSYKNIEVIVVDNKSTDNTKKLALKYTPYVYDKGPERSSQRNFGVRKAKGDFVLILDADMRLTPNVIRSCVKLAKYNDLYAVIIPEESVGKGFWAKCKRLERSFYYGVDWIEGARFFKRKIFLELGGYDEENTGTEDFDLSQRLEKKYGRKRIGRIKDIIIHNEGHLRLWRLCKKKFYYAQKLKVYKSRDANKEKFKKQASIFKRYQLYFSTPKFLIADPIVGIGMLFMKTCEFVFGALGYLYAKINSR